MTDDTDPDLHHNIHNCFGHFSAIFASYNSKDLLQIRVILSHKVGSTLDDGLVLLKVDPDLD